MEEKLRIGTDTIVVQNPDQISCELDGEVVAMSVARGEYSKLDDIGSVAWALLTQPKRVSDLCDDLMERFEVGRDECMTDVIPFLDDLHEREMIQIVHD